MADDDLQSGQTGGVGLLDPENEAGQPAPEGNAPDPTEAEVSRALSGIATALREIAVGPAGIITPDGQRIIINDATGLVRSRAKVWLRGFHLRVYDRAVLTVEGKPWEVVRFHKADREDDPITFLVPDFDSRHLLGEGSPLQVELYSTDLPDANCKIIPKLIYTLEPPDSEEVKKQQAQKSEEERLRAQRKEAVRQSAGPASMVVEAGGAVIGGIAQSFISRKQQNRDKLEALLQKKNKTAEDRRNIQQCITEAKNLGDRQGLRRAYELAKQSGDTDILKEIGGAMEGLNKAEFEPRPASQATDGEPPKPAPQDESADDGDDSEYIEDDQKIENNSKAGLHGIPPASTENIKQTAELIGDYLDSSYGTELIGEANVRKEVTTALNATVAGNAQALGSLSAAGRSAIKQVMAKQASVIGAEAKQQLTGILDGAISVQAGGQTEIRTSGAASAEISATTTATASGQVAAEQGGQGGAQVGVTAEVSASGQVGGGGGSGGAVTATGQEQAKVDLRREMNVVGEYLDKKPDAAGSGIKDAVSSQIQLTLATGNSDSLKNLSPDLSAEAKARLKITLEALSHPGSNAPAPVQQAAAKILAELKLSLSAKIPMPQAAPGAEPEKVTVEGNLNLRQQAEIRASPGSDDQATGAAIQASPSAGATAPAGTTDGQKVAAAPTQSSGPPSRQAQPPITQTQPQRASSGGSSQEQSQVPINLEIGAKIQAPPEKGAIAPSEAGPQILARILQTQQALKTSGLNLEHGPAKKPEFQPSSKPQIGIDGARAAGAPELASAEGSGAPRREPKEESGGEPLQTAAPPANLSSQQAGGETGQSDLADSGSGQTQNPKTAPTAEEPEPEEQPEEPPSIPLPQKKSGLKGLTSSLDRALAVAGNQEVAGIISKRIWTYGFGLSAAVFFSGCDFFLGAMIMDIYWFVLHRREPKLFPMSGLQKIGTVMAHVLPFVYATVILLLIWVTGCNFPFSGGGSVIGLAAGSQYCTLAGINGALTGTLVSNPPASGAATGPLSTTGWDAEIKTIAQSPAAGETEVNYCLLKVVVQKESAGNADVIGCDCAANSHPEYCPTKRKNYTPIAPDTTPYQFNWAQCSYGIGLTQWTIFPQGGSGYKAWQTPDVPSRNLGSGMDLPAHPGTWYGVGDFLNGNTSLQLTLKSFLANMKASDPAGPVFNRNDVQNAFGIYVGKSNVQGQLVSDRMALYDLCTSTYQGQ